MKRRRFFSSARRLDLQAKISLVLVGVVVPTFLVVTITQNKLTQPFLEDEILQIGLTSAKTLAGEIATAKVLAQPNPNAVLEQKIQDMLASQPNVVRIDVYGKDPITGLPKTLASNVEEDPAPAPQPGVLVENVAYELKRDEPSGQVWDISVPIEHKTRGAGAKRRLDGAVHLVISLQFVSQVVRTLWKITATAAAMSVVALILVLSYFLRKTIANDRALKKAETQNIALAEQLHETERQLMNTEKLAVMGQLTASFAHEIGTPLNAIGGHLQLMRDDLPTGEVSRAATERLDIIDGQVAKIGQIVKGFLQSTAKPTSQRQLIDVNRLVEKTLGIVRPRIESIGVEVKRDFDREMGPLRMVPLDLEQILLNLVNNSLDSLNAKSQQGKKGGVFDKGLLLELTTEGVIEQGKQWAEMAVYDTGEGIRKADLSNVLKPFFTTKRPGEGTGLGLTICRELARKYGGSLEIDSKEGTWTRVVLRFPYQTNT